MNTDLNLITNQANSPLIPFQERARESEIALRRLRHRFSGQLQPRREHAPLPDGTIILGNYDSMSDRRVQPVSITLGLNESAKLNNPSDWSSFETDSLINSPPELGTNVTKIIGATGLQRFEQFKKYGEGWEFGIGKPLSSGSIASFKLFCEQFSEPIPNEPSLFLTREGNLQLGWEDKEANKIEFEFFPDKIEYYIEALDDEGVVEIKDVSQLFDKLKPVIE